MKGLHRLFVFFNLWLLICVFGFTKVAEAQKESFKIIQPPRVDSNEIMYGWFPPQIIPKCVGEKLIPKIDNAHKIKTYLITEEDGGINISTDYYDESGKKILNVQILARNGVAFKATIRYKTANGKETYAIAEKTKTFSNVFMIHKATNPVDVYEFQIPILRWKEEIQERYNLYIKYFK